MVALKLLIATVRDHLVTQGAERMLFGDRNPWFVLAASSDLIQKSSVTTSAMLTAVSGLRVQAPGSAHEA